jgi:pimeloyl-ACP methyl ester carboxylesterase
MTLSLTHTVDPVKGARSHSLTLIEPVAVHILRGRGFFDRSFHGEFVSVAKTVTQSVMAGKSAEGMERFVDYWNGDGSWREMRAQHQAELCRHAPQVARDFAALLTEATPIGAYGRLVVPTLIIRGGKTLPITRRISDLLGATIPGAGLATIARAGHMLTASHPTETADMIADHIARANTTLALAA